MFATKGPVKLLSSSDIPGRQCMTLSRDAASEEFEDSYREENTHKGEGDVDSGTHSKDTGLHFERARDFTHKIGGNLGGERPFKRTSDTSPTSSTSERCSSRPRNLPAATCLFTKARSCWPHQVFL